MTTPKQMTVVMIDPSAVLALMQNMMTTAQIIGQYIYTDDFAYFVA